MLRYFMILKYEDVKTRHCMLQYFVILKCEVNKKDTACCATL